MSKRIYLMVMAMFSLPLLFSCSKDEEVLPPDTQNNNSANIQMVALNLSEETDEADVMLLCSDGSYILCNADNGDGYGFIYINSSVDNEFSEGITVFLDKDGTPKMASTNKGNIIFKNISDDCFDFAFINEYGNTSFYWDIPFPYISNGGQATTRAFYDPWVYSWKDFGSTVIHWSWDEHQKKAIVPFLCKVGSFAITAVGIVSGDPVSIASGVITLLDEANKSGDFFNSEWVNYVSNSAELIDFLNGSVEGGFKGVLKNGKATFSPKGFGLSMLATMLNEYADQELANMGKFEEWVAPSFEGKEWQIKLSTYLLECSLDESSYSVGVSSKAAWEIDDSNVNHSWCNISKENNRIIVNVKKHDGIEDRICSVKIKTITETSDISPATLTIRQSGVFFRLSSRELVFTQEGGEQGVNVTKSENVLTWSVPYYPNWCKVKPIKPDEEIGALVVGVEKDEHLLEDREGTITVQAQLKNGTTIERYLIVKQIVANTWDGTKWNFSGSVDASGSFLEGFDISNVTNFGIIIRSVERNDFTLTGDLEEMVSHSRIYCNEANQLIWSYAQSFSEPGVSVNLTTNITFTRTSTTTANGKLTGVGNVLSEYGNSNFRMTGDFYGNLISTE